jgi:RecA/RadA recombinase
MTQYDDFSDDFGSDTQLQEELSQPSAFQRPKIWLPSGVTLLDLFCSGSLEGAWAAGDFILIVGDSSSGKTWLTLSTLAEAVKHKFFKNHRLIYDDVENGVGMNIAQYFGNKLLNRIESPGGEDEETGLQTNSDTIEKFYSNLDDAFAIGDPFIYILDSMTALDSKAAEELFQTNKHKEGKDKASMGDGKAKVNSQNIRRYAARLRNNDSILIITAQTRTNLGVMFGDQKTYAGGKALKFFSHQEAWMSSTPIYQENKFDASKLGTLDVEEEAVTPKKKRGLSAKPKVEKADKKETLKKRVVGSTTTVKLKKNRGTGLLESIQFPIYIGYGIDDIQANIDFLVKTNYWKKRMGKISGVIGTEEFNLKESDMTLFIEGEYETELKELVESVFIEYVKTGHETRKPRYE